LFEGVEVDGDELHAQVEALDELWRDARVVRAISFAEVRPNDLW
jgi:hypothetical protein